MKNNIIVGAAVIVLIALGGWYVMSKNKTSNDDVNMPPGSETTSSGDEAKTESPVVNGTVTTTTTVTTSAVKEFTVVGSNFKFEPSVLSVNKGDTVKITFKDINGFHDFRIDEFNVATKQMQEGNEQTVTFIADKTGSFEYYCSVGEHRAMGMKGTLTVK
jgi:plastocyanin